MSTHTQPGEKDMLLGWKKPSFDDLETTGGHSMEPDEGQIDHQNDIVETVLESAVQKAEEENVKVGGTFELFLTEVPLEPHEDILDVDLDVALSIEAKNYGLLKTRKMADDDDSIGFQRV